MAHVTNQMKNNSAIWNEVDTKQVGAEALAKLLIVYPMTLKYFTDNDYLGSADCISQNTKVKSHGEKVMRSIGEAFKNIDNLNGYFTKRSKDDSVKLHVDPATFQHFGEVLIVVIEKRFHKEFNPKVEAAFKKGIGALADAFGKSSH